MTTRNFNNITTIGSLTGPVASSGVTLTTTAFSQFPAVPFTITLDRNTPTEEICLVTAAAGSTLTVTRGFDSTAAQAHAAGATVEHTAGAVEYTEANTHNNATSSVHGVTGSLVGAEGAQSLFDKTLVSPVLQSDTVAGDAAVAYDPTGVRNLFRGMSSAANDVFIVGPLGDLTAQTLSSTGATNVHGALAVTGASSVGGTETVTGVLNANGGVVVPSGKTVAANGGLTTTTITASGAVSGTTVTGTGLVKGAGVESTAELILDQIAAPAGVAAKDKLWSQSDGGLYTRAGTGAVSRLPVHWGSGTVYPTVGILTGDLFQHTGLGCTMRYDGTSWRQSDVPTVANNAARVVLSTTYLTSIYAGFEVWQTDFKLRLAWNGTNWLPLTNLVGIGTVTLPGTLTAATSGTITISGINTIAGQRVRIHLESQPAFSTASAQTVQYVNWAISTGTGTVVGATAALLRQQTASDVLNLPLAGDAIIDVTSTGALVVTCAAQIGTGGSNVTLASGTAIYELTQPAF